MIRCTMASPIRFSILTSFTTVLHVHRAEYSHSALRGVTYEVMKNWFSMYTKCSDICIAEALMYQPRDLSENTERTTHP